MRFHGHSVPERACAQLKHNIHLLVLLPKLSLNVLVGVDLDYVGVFRESLLDFYLLVYHLLQDRIASIFFDNFKGVFP